MKKIPKQIPWRNGGRSLGFILNGVHYVKRVIFGRRVRFSTGCTIEAAALAEYERFERGPVFYVSPLGRRAFAGVGTKGRPQRPSAANDAYRRRLALKYRLTPERHAEMLTAQAGCCAVCRRPAEESTGKVLAVDHSHETGEVRGLLCSHCNRGLGHFLDSPDLLRAAATYLERDAAKGQTLLGLVSKKGTGGTS